MSTAIHFFIGISDGQRGIEAIHVKLCQQLTLDRFRALVDFLNTDTPQFVSDINAGKIGTTAFERVALKVQELAAILPTAEVIMDENFLHYGVDVDYYDVGIPMPIENPVLVVNIFDNIHTRIYSDDFDTVLFYYLVGHTIN
jgi:hypothetical protein